jgi:hypothetical protein
LLCAAVGQRDRDSVSRVGVRQKSVVEEELVVAARAVVEEHLLPCLDIIRNKQADVLALNIKPPATRRVIRQI